MRSDPQVLQDPKESRASLEVPEQQVQSAPQAPAEQQDPLAPQAPLEQQDLLAPQAPLEQQDQSVPQERRVPQVLRQTRALS